MSKFIKQLSRCVPHLKQNITHHIMNTVGKYLILEPSTNDDFENLTLGSQLVAYGGNYQANLYWTNKHFCISPPDCSLKQKMVKSGKKIYCDLIFSASEDNLVGWIEELEKRCYDLIYDKRDAWFQIPPEKSDIENAFISCLKPYKSGKFYLMRVKVSPTLRIFSDAPETDESQSIDEFNASASDDARLNCVIEVQAIRFNDKYYQIEMEMRQAKMVSPDPFLSRVRGGRMPETNSKVSFNQAPTVTSTIFKSLPETIVQKEDENESDEPTKEPETKENDQPIKTETHADDLEEIGDTVDLNNLEEMNLKNHKEVYYEMYREAKKKADQLKRDAEMALLEAENIRTTYDLSSDEEDDEDDEEVDDYETVV